MVHKRFSYNQFENPIFLPLANSQQLMPPPAVLMADLLPEWWLDAIRIHYQLAKQNEKWWLVSCSKLARPFIIRWIVRDVTLKITQHNKVLGVLLGLISIFWWRLVNSWIPSPQALHECHETWSTHWVWVQNNQWWAGWWSEPNGPTLMQRTRWKKGVPAGVGGNWEQLLLGVERPGPGRDLEKRQCTIFSTPRPPCFDGKTQDRYFAVF